MAHLADSSKNEPLIYLVRCIIKAYIDSAAQRIKSSMHDMVPFSEKKLRKISRISQVIRDYFAAHASEKEVKAKELMPLLVEKGIFLRNDKNGLSIRSLVRQLDKENKLHLLKYAHVIRNKSNRNWYFTISQD